MQSVVRAGAGAFRHCKHLVWRCLARHALLLAAVLPSIAQAANPITRLSAFDYDPASGLLVKEVVEPQSSDLCLVTVHDRDALGRIRSTTTRNCNGAVALISGGLAEAAAPAAASLAKVDPRQTSFAFTADGRFVASTTNAMGHVETTDYDQALGVGKSLTGPNGLVTSWAYDALGRKTLQKSADGTGVRWVYQFCTSVPGGTDASCPTIAGAAGAYSVTEVAVKGPIDLALQTYGPQLGPYAKTYFDALSRTIRTETQTDASGSVRLVYQDTEYNYLGQVARKSRPYFAGDTAVWTSIAYDILGRVVSTSEPTGAGTASSGMAYDGLVTTSSDPLKNSTVETRNVAGQVVRILDAEQGTLSKVYDPLGNLVRTTDAKGNVTSIQYDVRGRREKLFDPDMGVWTYAYNAFGELVQQTDPKGQVTTTAYDLLGRAVMRTEPTQTSRWYFDRYADANTPCLKGIGKLCQVTVDNSFDRRHAYDSLGRLVSTTSVVGGTYTASVTYAADTGRVLLQTYPGGASAMQLRNEYTNLGFPLRMVDTRTNVALWTADQSDAEGRPLRYTYGNGVVTVNDYWVQGPLNTTRAGSNGSVQMLAHVYDRASRLLSRSDLATGVSAAYGYDKLGRLLSETRSGGSVNPAQTLSWTYDSIGNMVSRTEAGVTNTYNYASSGLGSKQPHAVASVSGSVNGTYLPRYSYDGNGNLASGAGRNVTWTSFDKVARIDKSGVALEFAYDADHERAVERYWSGGSLQRTTVYLNPAAGAGLYFEEESGAAGLKRKHYITAGGMTIGMATFNGSTWSMQYWHRDHLGSVSVVTNEVGTPVERMAYEPFGKRRQASGQTDVYGALVPASTDRGFTGHEHMDEVGLVNMNGRVYDPGLGRFLSADPFIQSPGVLQSYNRYSYVWNSPLNSTDPSGYLSLQREWRNAWHNSTVQAIATIYIAVNYGAKAAAAYSAAVTWYESGSLGQGLKAGLISWGASEAFKFVGAKIGFDPKAAQFQTELYVQKVLAHAVVGCLQGSASGGGCGSGAASAAAGAAITPFAFAYEERGVPIAAVAGGVGSVLAGGKFANGALTGAFGYLFNHCGRGGCRQFAEDAWRKFVGFFQPPVVLQGATFEVSTFVVDYSLAADTSGRVYLGGGKSLLPGETPGLTFKLHFSTEAWTPQKKFDFFDGMSINVGAQAGPLHLGVSSSPVRASTDFIRTFDLGIGTPGVRLGGSTGMSSCVANCPPEPK